MTVYTLLMIGSGLLGAGADSYWLGLSAWFIGGALIALVREQGSKTRDVLRQAVGELRRIGRK